MQDNQTISIAEDEATNITSDHNQFRIPQLVNVNTTDSPIPKSSYNKTILNYGVIPEHEIASSPKVVDRYFQEFQEQFGNNVDSAAISIGPAPPHLAVTAQSALPSAGYSASSSSTGGCHVNLGLDVSMLPRESRPYDPLLGSLNLIELSSTGNLQDQEDSGDEYGDYFDLFNCQEIMPSSCDLDTLINLDVSNSLGIGRVTGVSEINVPEQPAECLPQPGCTDLVNFCDVEEDYLHSALNETHVTLTNRNIEVPFNPPESAPIMVHHQSSSASVLADANLTDHLCTRKEKLGQSDTLERSLDPFVSGEYCIDHPTPFVPAMEHPLPLVPAIDHPSPLVPAIEHPSPLVPAIDQPVPQVEIMDFNITHRASNTGNNQTV